MKVARVAGSKRKLPLSEVYRLIEPGPVVLVSTADKGRSNLMAMSWHTMMEFEPPLVGCVISGRNHSHGMLVASGECTINVPTVELARQVVRCGNTSGRKIDKFEAFGLTPVPASKVKAPLVDECYANLECRVADSRWVEDYNFFVLEVVEAWISRSKKRPQTIHHQGKGLFAVDGERLRIPSKMK